MSAEQEQERNGIVLKGHAKTLQDFLPETPASSIVQSQSKLDCIVERASAEEKKESDEDQAAALANATVSGADTAGSLYTSGSASAGSIAAPTSTVSQKEEDKEEEEEEEDEQKEPAAEDTAEADDAAAAEEEEEDTKVAAPAQPETPVSASSTTKPRPVAIAVAPADGGPVPEITVPVEERDFDANPTDLYLSLMRKDWTAAQHHAPTESHIWIYRREQNDPAKIRWKLLPIHAAIIFQAPVPVLQALLDGASHGRRRQGRSGHGAACIWPCAWDRRPTW